MEHSFLAALSAILVTAAAVVFAMALSGSFEKEKTKEVFETAVSQPKEPQKTVLGVYEGKLAVFEGESPYPNRVFDFLVRTLPAGDRSALSEGITVSSEEELLRLLEDFMS